MELDTLTIDKIFKFEELDVKICGTLDKPYFCGKDVATILGYKDIKDCLQKNVSKKYKKTYLEIYEDLGLTQNGIDLNKPSFNEGRAIYITEAGLYELIFSSKMPIAIKFKEYVFEVVLPSIRKLGQEKYLKQLQEKEHLINEQEETINQMHNLIKIERNATYWKNLVFKNHLSLKRYIIKSDNIYTGSYEKQHQDEIYTNKCGLKTSNSRQTNFNTPSSPNNPFIFDNFEIYDGLEKVMEKYIHTLLDPLNIKKIEQNRREGSKEQFMVPRIWLNYFVDKAINFTNGLADEVNEIIDIIEKNELNFDKVEKEIKMFFTEDPPQEENKEETPEIKTKEETTQDPPQEENKEETTQDPPQEENKEETTQDPPQEENKEEIPTQPNEPEETKEEIPTQPNEPEEKVNETPVHATIPGSSQNELKINELIQKINLLKNTPIPDIKNPDEPSYLCKIKTPNAHLSPRSQYPIYKSGAINHYCNRCKSRDQEIQTLEKELKKLTHKRCTDCGVHRQLTEFAFKHGGARYATCNTCLAANCRNTPKKAELLNKLEGINPETLNENDKNKLQYLINQVPLLTKSDLKNKKQINILGDYKKCSLSLSHPGDEINLWRPINSFKGDDMRCNQCRTIQARIYRSKKPIKKNPQDDE